tara:strand:+ start:2824 stop:4074 length:1251 start_codon:yes stop_codon:yes gene_type:complete
MIYIWFPSRNGSVNITDIKSQIYEDMLRFVVGSALGNKERVVNGKPLGDIFKLPEDIRRFPDEVDDEYRDNAGEAKAIFLTELEQLKNQSLRDVLIEMGYGSFSRLDTYVKYTKATSDGGSAGKWTYGGEKGYFIPFPDITLEPTKDEEDAFLMRTTSAKQINATSKVSSDRYEQSLEEFVKPITGNIISEFSATDGLKLEITMKYTETKLDNKEELSKLGNTTPQYEERKDKFPISGNIRFTTEQFIDWQGVDLISPSNDLENNLRRLIYESLQTTERYKNEILSPKYVTSFEITGSIDDDFSGISELIISHVNKTEEKPEEETEKEKKKKVKYEKLLSKTHILRYKGEGLTTFVLVEEKSYVGRAFNVAPAGIDVPTVARGTKANNTILTHRDKLFSKIRGNLHHLEQAIESLT